MQKEDGEPALSIRVDAEGVRIGWVEARVTGSGTSPRELLALISDAGQRFASTGDDPSLAERKRRVRDMLRYGSYRPSGRGKPASEYLLNAALKEAFPSVSTLVDVNNLVSLEFLLPASLVDLDLAGTSHFVVRRGRESESYVFNPSGQVLALEDLLLVAALPADSPCASPVKDSQATKVHSDTRRVAGLIYAPQELAGETAAAAERMAELLARFGAVDVARGTC